MAFEFEIDSTDYYDYYDDEDEYWLYYVPLRTSEANTMTVKNINQREEKQWNQITDQQ